MEVTTDFPAVIEFGRFRVLPHHRELLADGRAVRIGGRAFDTLMALIEARGAVVGKDALMARVWPDRVVEENNLQSQIVALRKVFGPERELIRTVSGRGYQFIGEISAVPARQGEPTGEIAAQPTSVPPPTNVPAPVSELIGREEALGEIVDLAAEHRLITLTGPGGIGKTRLALEAARRLLPRFPDGVWLAELAPIADPGLTPAAVAAAAGLVIAAGELSAGRVAHALAKKRLLLVLDNCEHVIDVTAATAEAVLRAAAGVRIIATSREPLRTEGEWLYPVPPLAIPAEDPASRSDPLQYGAVRLFLERARAAEPRFAPDAGALALIASICRRLDGIPLAIELAAARSPALGIERLAAYLDDRFRLLTVGRRTALPRHQTLRAMLDWSYQLLPEHERLVLRRLGVFAGPFALEAPIAVVASAEIERSQIFDTLVSLVEKSLVVADASGPVARFRLLDTTRVYALEKLTASGESRAVARRHAEFYRDIFEKAEAQWQARRTTEWLAEYAWHINNLRAALDWAFSPDGEALIGVGLTTDAVPLWMHLSLMDECRSRVEQALVALDAASARDAPREMKLYAALATSLTYTNGTLPEMEAAWEKTLALAELLDDTEYRLRALWELWAFNRVSRWRDAALKEATRFCNEAVNQADPNHRLIGERILGVAHHYLGDQARARGHLETVLAQYVESENRSHIVRFQVDRRASARTFLARVLWLQGFPSQATQAADAAIEDARAADHAMSLCHALVFAACPLALMTGDLASGERYACMLKELSTGHGLTRWDAYARVYQGALLIKQGEVATGWRLVNAEFDQAGFGRLPFMDFQVAIVAEFWHASEIAARLGAVEKAITEAEESGELRLIAELLRIKGEMLLIQGGPNAAATAERLFRQALDWARRQGALSWELRAATNLARLMRDHDRPADAMALLQPVYDRFTEGFDTVDLKTAKALLDALR